MHFFLLVAADEKNLLVLLYRSSEDQTTTLQDGELTRHRVIKLFFIDVDFFLSWPCAICIFISTPGSNPCSYHHQLTLLAFKISLFDEAKRRNSVDLHLQVPPDLNQSDALQFRLHEETMDFHQ